MSSSKKKTTNNVEFDNIIVKNKNSLSVKLLDHNDELDNMETSMCLLEFSGNSMNYVITSTLRRIIMTLLPAYSFHINNIKFTKNTSVFSNDLLALRYSNYPVYFKKELNKKYAELKKMTDIHVINPQSTINNFQILEYKATLGSAEIDKTADLGEVENINDNVTIVVNVKNTTNQIMDVMTNTPGVKFYYKSEQISHIYNMPLLVVQLQPNQEISCTMIANLNIAMFHATYRQCSLCFVTEENPTTFKFKLMSKRQISEKDMFIRACEIIKIKTMHAKSIFHENIDKFKTSEEDVHTTDITSHHRSGRILIEGEQHTIGNLITRYLQDNPSIIAAGYKVNHPNVNNCEISYESKKNILDIIDEVAETIVNVYDDLQTQIENLGSFGYQYI